MLQPAGHKKLLVGVCLKISIYIILEFDLLSVKDINTSLLHH